MKIISWNLNARSRASVLRSQCNYLLKGRFDLITLQEVTSTSVGFIKKSLEDIGGYFVVSSLDLARDHKILLGRRKYGEVIASRFRFSTNDPGRMAVPFPERVLSVELVDTHVGLNIHTTHVPPGSTNGVIKVEHFEGLSQFLNETRTRFQILTGDFNSPQLEHSTHGVVTWGQRLSVLGQLRYYINPRWRAACSAERWDAAERSIIEQGSNQLLYDAFRSIPEHGEGEYSWVMKRKGRETKRRYDHIFVSSSINTRRCYYDQEPRQAGLSDHSPIIAEIEV
jgi:exonuclease III